MWDPDLGKPSETRWEMFCPNLPFSRREDLAVWSVTVRLDKDMCLIE